MPGKSKSKGGGGGGKKPAKKVPTFHTSSPGWAMRLVLGVHRGFRGFVGKAKLVNAASSGGVKPLVGTG